ncbi:MAG TPA: glycosyltransferase family 39 protein [Candidatus Acidoferrum sp.]|nr:glycosyltransferase family 39 protein [Candidatus Acidoferrum sp.]
MYQAGPETRTDGAVAVNASIEPSAKRSLAWSAALVLVALGVVVRIWFVAAPKPNQLTFHSGGSDAPAYNLLAQNLLDHRGFSYAGEPSALRAPGYPLLIAAIMSQSRTHYIVYIRWLQFLLGLATVGVCAAAARRLFDKRAAIAVCILGLFMPTLIFTTAQLLTECLAAFFTAAFLFYLIMQMEKADLRSAAGLGITAGIESLIRFNAAALPLFAGCAVLQTRRRRSAILRAGIVLLVPLLIVVPWLVRNELAFHGRVLFSTQSGPNAVQGVITPEGRTQPGDSARLRAAMGWVLSEIETNDPSRRSFPSEADLNINALRVAPGLWRGMGWHAIPLLVKKLAVFWLSADQLEDTSGFRFTDRVLRSGGVVYYWIVLGLAIGGWLALRKSHSAIALTFAIYAGGITLLHLPLVMSTRIRIPLIEPLVLILAGGVLAKRHRVKTVTSGEWLRS